MRARSSTAGWLWSNDVIGRKAEPRRALIHDSEGPVRLELGTNGDTRVFRTAEGVRGAYRTGDVFGVDANLIDD